MAEKTDITLKREVINTIILLLILLLTVVIAIGAIALMSGWISEWSFIQ